MLSDFYIPNFHCTIFHLALKCYNGTIGDLELVECPTKPIDRLGVIDSCINVTSEKGNFYTCSRKAAIEADTKIQMEDNQCRTSNVRFLGMTEVCICDTDGCNYEVRNRSLPRESTGNPINYLIYSEIRFQLTRHAVDKQTKFLGFYTRLL